MRNLVSPLRGIKTPFVFNALYDLLRKYLANNLRPAGVLDFGREVYVGKTGRVTDPLDIVTYTGASASTMFDASGTLVTVPIGTPRLNSHIYNGTAWVNNGLFLESEARTNLIPYSQDFSNGAWTGAAITKTADQTGPDGAANSAFTISETTDAALGGLTETVSCADDSVARTLSVHFKKTTSAATFPGITLFYSGGTSVNNGLTINTDTGGVTERTGVGVTPLDDYFIEDLGDFWRVSAVALNNGTGNTSVAAIIYPAVNTDGGATWVASVTGSCVAYGAQLEAGSTPSSYIPTAGSTVTRAAQTAVIEPANNPILERGPELVTNGAFDSDTSGWTGARSNSVLSLSGGALRTTADAAGAYGPVQELPPMVIGQTYQYSVEVVDQTSKGSSAFFRVSASADLNDTSTLNLTLTTNGTLTGTFTASATTLYVGAIGVATSGSSFLDFDNVSVKSLSMPTALSIGLKGKMTYADEDAGIEAEFIRYQLDGNNNIRVWLDTGGVKTGGVDFNQEVAGVNTGVPSTGDDYSPGINVPFNIASRNGDTFINGAVDGTALTADLTPTALPDPTTADFQIGPIFMGHILELPLYAVNVADAGLEDITS